MVITIPCAIAAVLVADWLFVGKLVAGFADFDYRYWPPTWPRVISLTLATITASVSALLLTPGAMPVWSLSVWAIVVVVWAIVVGLWMVVAVDEVARQRALGYRRPPRYSDQDD